MDEYEIDDFVEESRLRERRLGKIEVLEELLNNKGFIDDVGIATIDAINDMLSDLKSQ